MISQILCYLPCITRYSVIFIVKKGVIAMSNESKIRILYVQPGKYPEKKVIEHTLAATQTLVGGDIAAVYLA